MKIRNIFFWFQKQFFSAVYWSVSFLRHWYFRLRILFALLVVEYVFSATDCEKLVSPPCPEAMISNPSLIAHSCWYLFLLSSTWENILPQFISTFLVGMRAIWFYKTSFLQRRCNFQASEVFLGVFRQYLDKISKTERSRVWTKFELFLDLALGGWENQTV